MSNKTFAYAGSQSGVHVFHYDAQTGTFSPAGRTAERFHASALLPGKHGTMLYCADSCSDLPGSRAGGGSRIFAYGVSGINGALSPMGVTPTQSATAVDLAFDAGENHLLVAHYGGNEAVTKVEQDAFGKYQLMVRYDDATVSVFGMDQAGTVGELLDVRQHDGCGPKKDQRHAHPKHISLSPDGAFFAVCDCGADTLHIYKLSETGRLFRCGEPVRLAPGASPRAGVFHTEKPFYYLCDESRGSVLAYAVDEKGRPSLIGSYAAGSDRTDAAMPTLCLSRDGKRLYALCNNTIAVFSVDPSQGLLTNVQTINTGAHFPTECTLAPDGRFMHVVSSQSGVILTFAVKANGTLSAEPTETLLPGCTCLAFISVEAET